MMTPEELAEFEREAEEAERKERRIHRLMKLAAIAGGGTFRPTTSYVEDEYVADDYVE